MSRLKILVAQINPILGDLATNTKKIIAAIQRAQEQKADLVVFSELVLTGYPPEDLLLLGDFIPTVEENLQRIIDATNQIAVIIGLPRINSNRFEKPLYNSAAIIVNQQLIDYADKILLPTYDVFDERRYFESGEEIKVWSFKGFKIGISICEDAWGHSESLKYVHYRRDPIIDFKEKKLDLMINLSASPYSYNKFNQRMKVFSKVVSTLNCPLLLCNQVGGQDSLIFDGHSFFLTQKGIEGIAKGFSEDDLWINWPQNQSIIHVVENKILDLYQALVLGIRDYFSKSGFKKGCLGLSGGIDSALVACLTVEALGAENVLGLIMPSRFSSPESARDARKLGKHLQIEVKELSIEEPFESYLSLLEPHFNQLPFDVTEENIQARIRGMLLMSFCNKFGYLLLSTGNKTEYSMGYSTLYGDMCGGLAVIGDLTKKQVYDLAKGINHDREIIPEYSITRAPSAELRQNQKDSDSLPDYEILDQIVESYIENHQPAEWIAETFQYPLTLIKDLIRKIHLNEYKRRQAPPVLRVSEKSFSIGRKFPIVQGWVK